MKKISSWIISLTVSISVILIIFYLTSCNRTLETPRNLALNDNEILTWNEVKGASKYEVNINSKTIYSDKNELDLFFEFDDSCEYIIDIRAIGKNKTSSYSESITYKIPQISLEMLKTEPIDKNNKNGDLYIKGFKSDIKGKIIFPNLIDGKHYILFSQCFKNCEGLTGLIFEDEITRISASAFEENDNLRFVMMKNVNSIGPKAFENCSKLEKINLSDGIQIIDEYAFKDCLALKTIDFPAGVKNIEGNIVAGCTNLEKISIEPNDTYEVVDNCLINKEKGSVILGCNFSTIPTDKNITRIEKNAFTKVDFEKIIIPENITEIGQFAFRNNFKLKEVVLHDKMILIDQWAFANCYNLEKVIIPTNIEKMYGFQLSSIPIIIHKNTIIKNNVGYEINSNYIPTYNYYFYERNIKDDENSKLGYIYGCEFCGVNEELYVSSIQKPQSITRNILIPKRKGYKFLGWSLSQNKEDIVTTIKQVELSYIFYVGFNGYEIKSTDEKGNPILIQVTEFDSSIDYSNVERLYAIWEKE